VDTLHENAVATGLRTTYHVMLSTPEKRDTIVREVYQGVQRATVAGQTPLLDVLEKPNFTIEDLLEASHVINSEDTMPVIYGRIIKGVFESSLRTFLYIGSTNNAHQRQSSHNCSKDDTAHHKLEARAAEVIPVILSQLPVDYSVI
jgi:hypothetical protein